MNALEKLGASVIAVPLTIALIIPLGLWRAFAATVLWGWFVTPLSGVAAPDLWAAFGLVTLLSLLTASFEPAQDGADGVKRLVGSTVFWIFLPATALLLGWIITLFM